MRNKISLFGKVILLSVFVFSFFALDVSAQSCSCSACSAGLCAVSGSGGSSGVLEKGKWIAEISGEYIPFHTIYSDYGKEFARVNGFLQNAVVTSLGLNYGINNKLSIAVYQPLIWIKPEGSNSLFGTGDVNVLLNYNVYSCINEKLKAVLIGGCELPTGSRARVSDAASVSVSSGSVDPMAGVAVSYSLNRFKFIASGLYKNTTKGYNDIYFGNLFSHRIACNYSLSKSAADSSCTDMNDGNMKSFLTVALKGESLNPQHLAGAELINTGSYSVFAEAGITILLSEKWSVPFNFDLPVYQRMNGVQNIPDYRLKASVKYSF